MPPRSTRTAFASAWSVLLAGLLVGVVLGCGGPRALPVRPVMTSAGDERLWQDGPILARALELIVASSTRVWVEMYEIDRADLVEALVRARGRGADVRLVFDPSVAVSARTAASLRARGVAALAYPLDDSRHQIDHVKLLLTDEQGLLGGMNWGSHSGLNHDYALEEASAPARARLAEIFEQDWQLASGQPVGARPPEAAGIAQTSPGEGIRSMLELGLASARVRIWAELFVLTDPALLRDLAAAARRGASVRVLLDPNQDVNRPSYQLLSRLGVGVRWYPVPVGAKLHAKAAVLDGLLVLGSANWSRSGLGVNHELDARTDRTVLVDGFVRRFQTDWEASA